MSPSSMIWMRFQTIFERENWGHNPTKSDHLVPSVLNGRYLARVSTDLESTQVWLHTFSVNLQLESEIKYKRNFTSIIHVFAIMFKKLSCSKAQWCQEPLRNLSKLKRVEGEWFWSIFCMLCSSHISSQYVLHVLPSLRRENKTELESMLKSPCSNPILVID